MDNIKVFLIPLLEKAFMAELNSRIAAQMDACKSCHL